MKYINKIILSGAAVYPIVEGGKGIGVSNGNTSGAFAAAGAVGTLSGVCPPLLDNIGRYIPPVFLGKSRRERHREVVEYSISGTIREVKKAFELADGNGRIHINMLWGVAGAEQIIQEVLKATRGMVHGVTCGAGMPYRLAEIAKEFEVYYYPIISSTRAFSALWARSFKQVARLLGGVVYEDPWKAGGHNGLSNKENPLSPLDPYPRVAELRRFMNKEGLQEVPIIMAGGVWQLQSFEEWLDNPEIGPVAFQLGTRPMLTKESPISEQWKQKLLEIQPGDITINKYSATGFHSSALNNDFLRELHERSGRQIAYNEHQREDFVSPFHYHSHKPAVYTKLSDRAKINEWIAAGFTEGITTPDSTLIFVTKEKALEIRKDQKDCKGCLAACKFSSWCISEEHNFTTGQKADPRSFCIFKSLQNAICGNDVENELLFSGHQAYLFGQDPLYANGNIPSTKELIEKLLQGE